MTDATKYERFVRDIVAALIRGEGIKTIKVQHNVLVRGLSREHQIDVYWEYELGGLLHRVIVNCKRHSRAVEVTDVLTLSGVLADLPGVRGLIVTTVGFQSGAVEYARLHNIGLKVIRPPTDDDWEGMIREARVEFELDVPELVSTYVEMNRAWAEANFHDPESLLFKGLLDARATVVHDVQVGTRSDMNELWNRVMRENPTAAGAAGEGAIAWQDAYLERAGSKPVKIDSIAFRWRIRIGESRSFAVRHEPAAIVRDAINGTLLFINPEDLTPGHGEE